MLVPGGEDWTAALTVPQDDVRVTFAVPWYGLLLLGTTDSDYEGDPADVAVDEADVAQILDEAATALPASLLGRDEVRASFAGLRVLPLGDGATANARRETVFSIGPGGMLSVAGGKLTTYRKIALDALERVARPPRPPARRSPSVPAPGRARRRAGVPGRAGSGCRGASPAPLRQPRGRCRRARGGRPHAARPAPPGRAGHRGAGARSR